MGTIKHIKIGTRGSALALFQAELTKSLLEQSCRNHGFPFQFEIVEIRTTGDKVQDRRLSDMGGKALFTKEIDLALLDGRIDMAVHSIKDCETFLPPAFELACILEREDPRDAVIANGHKTLDEIPDGATIGTCSLRRTSQLLHIRPDLKPVLFRGNIQTRIAKIKSLHEADFTLLGQAGLNRMALQDQVSFTMDSDVMTPCVGQGAIGIVCLNERIDLKEILGTINHRPSYDAIMLERFFLEHINGHCGTPVGGLITLQKDVTNFTACVATPDGKHLWREHISEPTAIASQTIAKLGKEMQKWLECHDV